MKKNLDNHLPEDIYKKLAEELYDGVYFTDKDRKIIFWNRQAENITGYKKKEVLNSHCFDNIQQHIDKNGRTLCTTKHCPLLIAMKSKKPYATRAYLRRKDGVRIPVDVHTLPITYRGKITGAIEVFRDASMYERIEKQRERAKTISIVDQLTSLPNRRFILKRLKLEFNKFKKFKDDLHVAIADIDYFKKINDSFGHDSGDLVLRKIAHILEHKLRVTDYIGRYGGEEFLILLPNTPKENCHTALERVREKIENSNMIHAELKTTISIGVAKAKPDDTHETIFKRADEALYKAKKRGRNRIVFL